MNYGGVSQYKLYIAHWSFTPWPRNNSLPDQFSSLFWGVLMVRLECSGWKNLLLRRTDDSNLPISENGYSWWLCVTVDFLSDIFVVDLFHLTCWKASDSGGLYAHDVPALLQIDRIITALCWARLFRKVIILCCDVMGTFESYLMRFVVIGNGLTGCPEEEFQTKAFKRLLAMYTSGPSKS